MRHILSATALISGLLCPLAAIGETTDVSIADAEVDLGAEEVTLEFPLTRGGDTSFDTFIGFHTEDGTAEAGTDYTAASGVVKIPAGDTSATIPVTVAANTAPGPDLTLSMLLDGATGVGPAPDFAAQQGFETGSGPRAATAADVNGDGRPDLIAANLDSGTVSVLLNTTAPGAATPDFAAQQTFETGDLPNSVAAVDVNGDGKPDLAVANRNSDTVSVLLNTTAPGAATPAFAAQQTFATGSAPVSVTAVDVNGDGKPDLILANQTSNTASVLLNITDPGATTPAFAAQQTFATGDLPNSVTAADVNGDGKPDLAVANRNSDTVSVLLNTTAPGAATPDFAAQQTFETGSQPASVTTADVNGDGTPDLIAANFSSDTASVLLNTTAPGAATPAFADQQTFATDIQPSSVTAADVNGDGKPDLLVANSDGAAVSVLLNATAPGSAASAFAAQLTFATGTTPSSVAAADVNGDGQPDLLVANSNSDTVSVLLNTTPAPTAAPSFATQQPFATGSQPRSVTAADVNGDGRPDLIVANWSSDNTVSVLLNTTTPGEETPAFADQETFDTGTAPTSVTAADVNGDGRPDLLVANQDGTVSVLLNATAPGAETPVFADQETFATGSAPFSVTAADVNGDGTPDLIVPNSLGGTVSVLLNTTTPGAMTPTFAAQQTFATDIQPLSVTAVDVNGDGRPDLIVANRFGDTVSVLLNTTDPGAATPAFAAQQTFATNLPVSVTAADVNGDGRPDLIVATEFDTIDVLLNTTAPGATQPAFADRQTFATGSAPNSVTATDVNGDGRPDLMVSNFGGDTVSVLLNTTAPGDETAAFAAQQTFAAGTSPISVTAADVNGDGQPDLIATNLDSDTASVLLNTRHQVTLGGSPATGTLRRAGLTVDPGILDFGDVDVGTMGPPQITTLQNVGGADATGLAFEGPVQPFEADTSDCAATLPAGDSCQIVVTFTPQEAGSTESMLEVTSDQGVGPTLLLTGDGVDVESFTPTELTVDTDDTLSDANGVFEPGESVDVAPAWRNDGSSAQFLEGTASDFTGPEGPTYSIVMPDADYGELEPGAIASCQETGLCYEMDIGLEGIERPVVHWDAQFTETLSDADETSQTWTLHVGDSFTDVPRSSLFYTAIETLLHSGVTGGCGDGSAYCPGDANTRSQMPAFMLRVLEGTGYTPEPCVEGDKRLFDDVPASNLFCAWIEDLADRGIVSGCGGGNYCPSGLVSRAQMSIFLLKTLQGTDYAPPECSSQFTDVPCPSLFADWIEDLAARGITGGCTETEYCPGDAVTRAQMASFITRAFGLTLYGP